MTMVVRTASDADMMASQRAAVWSLDRQAAVYDTVTLADVVEAETWRERLGARIGVIFAGVALLLAAFGISSVVRYAVTRRWREFGVTARARRHAGPRRRRSPSAKRLCLSSPVWASGCSWCWQRRGCSARSWWA